MRLRRGRPQIRDYQQLFGLRTAAPHELSVTFLGVSTLLIDDGQSAVMTDGFFSRPSLLRAALGRIEPNVNRIDNCLARASVRRLDAIIPVHTHYDHALDTAVVAERTGAVMVGGDSAANLALGHGLPAGQFHLAEPDKPMTYGHFTLRLSAAAHCPPDRYPGEITEPLTPPARASAYRCGEAWAIHLEHRSGHTMAILGSAGVVDGALAGLDADVVYLGVGQLGLQPAEYITDYWSRTVRRLDARRVVLIHWDDFFRPLNQRLRALPYFGDDLDHTMSVLSRLAARDDVQLFFPTVWERQTPWR